MISFWTVLGLVGMVKFQKPDQPSGFSQSRAYVLVFSSFHLPIKKIRNVCQAFIYILGGTGSSVMLLCGRINCYQFLSPAAILCF